MLKGYIYQIMKFMYTCNEIVFYSLEKKSFSETVVNTNIIKVDWKSFERLSPLIFVDKKTKSNVISEIKKGSLVYLNVSPNNEVMHHSCLSNSIIHVGEIRRYFLANENRTYIYNCKTECEFRKRGLYKETLSYIINEFSSDEFYICSLKNNRPSISIINKLGFSSFLNVKYTRVFGFGKYYVSNSFLSELILRKL